MEVASCKSSNPGLWLFKKNFFLGLAQTAHALFAQEILFSSCGHRGHPLFTIGWLHCHSHLHASYWLAALGFLPFCVCPSSEAWTYFMCPSSAHFFLHFFFFLCVFLQFRVHLFQLAPLCASPPSVLLVPSSPASHMRIPACITWPCPHHSLFINFQSCCCTTQLKDHHKASCSFMPILVFR